jgi:8-oxo-dGTP pyrophosphatase MutT (NUDIX family)
MTDDSVVHEAGAIATRLVHDAPQVLLVHANTPGGEWILPKGHLEDGETPAETAVRELREEAGVEGEAVQLVDTLQFTARARQLRVDYFLVRAGATIAPGEPKRQPTWFTFDEAIAAVKYEDTRALLAKARDIYVRSLA